MAPRRRLLFALLAASVTAGCGKPAAPPGPPPRPERIDRALADAAHYLRDRQDPDGAWRSDTYGAFKDGASLTPLVLDALLAIDAGDLDPAGHQGCAYLAGLIRPDGTLDAGPLGPSYPGYTAALSVIALSDPRCAAPREARNRWLAFLRRRQFTEALGWRPGDAEYGGWGFGA
ncbi:MAG TPA: hypothetical protein VFA26_00305, partial [Gemmataceae bacterium]|nr:hypothetical protein [Gemmataceae bacterium]